MGLDMYAYTTPDPIADVDFDAPANITELAYWRKHPNLHGWMEALYRDKGGTDPAFNCAAVRLTSTDLDQLEADLRDGLLPEADGFFFGTTRPDEIELDLRFISDAREAIGSGRQVFYTSWW